MDAEQLRRILREARVVAVVGASRDPHKDAHRVPAYLASRGYEIIPINPHAREILGRGAHADLRALPPGVAGRVDVVLLFRPSGQVGRHVQAAIERGMPVVWMQAGIRHEAWSQRARRAGLLVVQDACMRTAHRLLIETD